MIDWLLSVAAATAANTGRAKGIGYPKTKIACSIHIDAASPARVPRALLYLHQHPLFIHGKPSRLPFFHALKSKKPVGCPPTGFVASVGLNRVPGGYLTITLLIYRTPKLFSTEFNDFYKKSRRSGI
jgi:hypothetical protein